MPNMSGHMAIAKKVSDILKINDKNFIIGNVLPDLYEDKVKSHFKIQGKKYMIPDIELVKEKLNLHNKKYLGYLCHLLLDKYYLEELLIYIDDDVFETKKIYKDYDILNKDIVKYFNLDVEYITEVLKNVDDQIDNNKLELNISCLKKNEEGETYYLTKETFIKFLDETATRIAEEVRPYAS